MGQHVTEGVARGCVGFRFLGRRMHDRETFESSFVIPRRRTRRLPLGAWPSVDTPNYSLPAERQMADRRPDASLRVMGTAFLRQASGWVAAACHALAGVL